MRIIFNEKKNESNYSDHGYYLEDARNLDWDGMLVYEDDRVGYGEYRYVGITYGIAHIGNQMFSVCFTMPEDEDGVETYRIISLRKATKVEIRKYAEA